MQNVTVICCEFPHSEHKNAANFLQNAARFRAAKKNAAKRNAAKRNAANFPTAKRNAAKRNAAKRNAANRAVTNEHYHWRTTYRVHKTPTVAQEPSKNILPKPVVIVVYCTCPFTYVSLAYMKKLIRHTGTVSTNFWFGHAVTNKEKKSEKKI